MHVILAWRPSEPRHANAFRWHRGGITLQCHCHPRVRLGDAPLIMRSGQDASEVFTVSRPVQHRHCAARDSRTAFSLNCCALECAVLWSKDVRLTGQTHIRARGVKPNVVDAPQLPVHSSSGRALHPTPPSPQTHASWWRPAHHKLMCHLRHSTAVPCRSVGTSHRALGAAAQAHLNMLDGLACAPWWCA